jgi:hypothetical protein
MSLLALEPYDQATAANILAAAAFLAGPDPKGGDRSFVDRYSKQAEAVLAEVRDSLSSRRRGARISISSFLSDEMDSLLLAPEQTATALERAGQAGRLVPSIYKVVQPNHFRQQFAPLGIKKSDVETAIKQPTDFQHLMTEEAAEDARDALSLFMRVMRPSGGGVYWLLVQTHRQGIEQRAISAWRVYDGDVDLNSASTPLEVLRAFVERFGLIIRVGPIASKFIEGVDIPTGEDGNVKFSFSGEIPRGHAVFSSVSHVKLVQPSTTIVGIGYSIDLSEYRNSLISRGVIQS